MKHPPPQRPSRAERLRGAAEAQTARAPPHIAAPGHPVEELRQQLHGHQVELEMQIEELQQAQLELEAARDRYVDLYDFAPVGYFTLSVEGLIAEANLTGALLLGEERVGLVGRRFARHVAPADRDRWHRYALSLRQHDDRQRIELALTASDGRTFQAQVDGVRTLAPDPMPVLRITLTDVTERKRTETELRIAATAFEAQEGIMITDVQGVIERVNNAFTRITGYSAAEAVGRTGRLLQSGRQSAAFYAAMWDSLQRTGTWQGELWNRRKNGELYPQWLTIAAVRDDAGAVARYVGTMLDISERKSYEDEIAQLAFYDPLTGLPNRRLMKDRLHQALSISTRSRHEGALIYVDLDHFKHINDTLGHDQGDLLLQQVAQRLAASVRECDTVARPGGDEFVVMLAANLSDAHTDAVSQAKAVSEKILAALSGPYQIAGQEYRGTASIGVTLFSNHIHTVDELLRRADQAMYRAKTGGRNAVCFFDAAMQNAHLLRSTLNAELCQALQQGEFILHYEPKVDRERRLRGAEALVRWQHPHRGFVLPGEFIAVAEDSGLIHALGLWVLETACTQLAAWSADPHLARLTMSVNVSARQLRDKHFVQQVLQVLDRSRADATRLRLELTESVMLDNIDDGIAKLTALKARGVGISLDDFGTGFASLVHLKRLPLDQLKIDRSFVRNVLTDTRDAAIARAIVALGRSLGLTVIAEGVETAAQFELLASYGCDVFQGYLFGPPASADALRQMAYRSNDAQATSSLHAALPPAGEARGNR